MLTDKQLFDELNARDFQAWPQPNNPKRVTLHLADENGARHFITRTSAGLGADGKANYIWAKGKAMRPRADATPA